MCFFKLIERLYFKKKNNLALYCQLTEVFNSNWLRIIASKKFLKKEYFVTMIDLNCLKAINDCKGHDVGDRVLKYLASELKDSFNNKGDYICRYGGDEFLLLTKYDPLEILKTLDSEFCYGTITKNPGEHLFSAIAAADTKMYLMKKKKELSCKFN